MEIRETAIKTIRERLLQNGMSESQVDIYFQKFISGKDGPFGALVDAYPEEEFAKLWFTLSDADKEEFMPIVFPILDYPQEDTKKQTYYILKARIADRKMNVREMTLEDESWFSFKHKVGILAGLKSNIRRFIRTNNYASNIVYLFNGKSIKDIYNMLLVKYQIMMNNRRIKKQMDKIIKTGQDPAYDDDASCNSDCMWTGVRRELKKETYPENIKSTRQEDK